MEINLRDYYPFYETDEAIEVPEKVYKALLGWERQEVAYRRRLYRTKAYYSLNRGDDVGDKALKYCQSPFKVIVDKMAKHQLYTAIASLPDKQAKRLYAYFFLNMSIKEIAAVENISHTNVSRTIKRALKTLRQNLNNLL